MLNTVRFAAIVDTTNLEVFKHAALVPYIKKNDAEVGARQKKIEAMLEAQIRKWTENKDKYPDTYTISFNTSGSYKPPIIQVNLAKGSETASSMGWQYVFSLAHDKNRSETWQKFLYFWGSISPEKHLQAFLKQIDSEISRKIKRDYQ